MANGFSSVAKTLISRTAAPVAHQKTQVIRPISTVPEVGEADHLQVMNDAGFSVGEIFRDYRELLNECTDEDKTLKKQILDTMVKVRGLMTPDESVRATPIFQIVVQGDNTRVNTMLCPNLGARSADG